MKEYWKALWNDLREAAFILLITMQPLFVIAFIALLGFIILG